MTTNSITSIFTSLVLFLSCGLFPAYAEVTHVCDVDELFRDYEY